MSRTWFGPCTCSTAPAPRRPDPERASLAFGAFLAGSGRKLAGIGLDWPFVEPPHSWGYVKRAPRRSAPLGRPPWQDTGSLFWCWRSGPQPSAIFGCGTTDRGSPSPPSAADPGDARRSQAVGSPRNFVFDHRLDLGAQLLAAGDEEAGNLSGLDQFATPRPLVARGIVLVVSLRSLAHKRLNRARRSFADVSLRQAGDDAGTKQGPS